MSLMYYERRVKVIKEIATKIKETEKEKADVYQQRIELNKKFNDLTQQLVVLKKQLIDESMSI